MTQHKEYYILPALKEDINSPFVWITDNNLSSRSIIKLKNAIVDKCIFCEALVIDENFIKQYNNSKQTYKIFPDKNILVINEWYRNKILLKKNQTAILEIKSPCKFFAWTYQIKAGLLHPDSCIRLCCVIAVLSALLGILSVILGVLSIWK